MAATERVAPADRITMSTIPQGIGLGLRVDMAQAFLEAKPDDVAFVEVHPENYVARGGRYRQNLARAQDLYPVLTHGLTTCFGQLEPFDATYLAQLKRFLADVDTPWHSDHLCFGGAGGAFAHDLLPIPFTDEALDTVTQRFTEVRDAIDRELAFENVSYYAPMSADPLDEARFCVEVLERADAKLMLDVNNVFVNSRNFGFDPKAWIDLVPPERVVQMHVAGHLVRDDGLRIDTHGEPIPEGVYELLDYTLRRTGPRPVLLERDNNIPSLGELLAEVRRLNAIYRDAVGEEAA
ncbi:MAG TPA: DUF692 domain-containing protein [Polyangiaceae bacterium LLY-WYZ-15_(1-7)]|nr:DUF692 domain-containing protein [Polyangiaceae bacterium LLY-WYZ-15_(1-7)]HJL01095.1 DUF692 domain-containing protein [Polyangiaceae bacterium LLY-WYZ-15_(1-7)]HJL12064.1 DUF692 domain-containing protein [Polyangiaceae bacterium LLY-WYZ-15_(1-7)]HJL23031.1 DUF692 domain-containing protein [Polyangiaceae bacterium LLY-WYZ-15_(1-7)]HJL37966.1 DUF692 domain-containing protein [Polyangiaceae bacterium LLY-WYZ-15_(1-7)]